MGSTAQVDELALAIERYLLSCWNGADNFGLVRLAEILKKDDGGLACHELALDRDLTLGQLGHFGFDGAQVCFGEPACVGKIVIEAVFDHRAYGHLGLGIQFLDRMRQQMRAGMADNLQTLGIALGNDGEIGVVVYGERRVHQLAVDLTRQGGLGQARAYSSGYLSNGDGVGKFPATAVRQGDNWHG